MEEDLVVLVDCDDNEIGMMPKLEAHQKALLHRAVSVFLFNSNGEWLLQRRAFSKYHSGGLWTNTCCTHPLPNESNIDAAKRRLEQEMGIQCELSELFSFTYMEKLNNNLSEYEFDHVFIGFSDSIPVLDSGEVSESKYIGFKELELSFEINPEQYTVWFSKIYKQVQCHFLKSCKVC